MRPVVLLRGAVEPAVRAQVGQAGAVTPFVQQADDRAAGVVGVQLGAGSTSRSASQALAEAAGVETDAAQVSNASANPAKRAERAAFPTPIAIASQIGRLAVRRLGRWTN